MKHGVIIGTRTIGGTGYLDGAIEAFPDNQFVDLEMIGFVREATDEEIAAALQPPAPILLLSDDTPAAETGHDQRPATASEDEALPVNEDDPK